MIAAVDARDFTSARAIYANGQNSLRSDGSTRKLQGTPPHCVHSLGGMGAAAGPHPACAASGALRLQLPAGADGHSRAASCITGAVPSRRAPCLPCRCPA